MSSLTDTFMDYSINLRQKFTEDILRESLVKLGGSYRPEHSLASFHTVPEAKDDRRIEAVVKRADGSEVKIRSKYLIGADGGRSTVRQLAEIAFEGEETQYRWVRMDGIIHTNMPDARLGIGAVESATHGSCLWVPYDHLRTRIGYNVSQELFDKYKGTFTQEDAIHEAKLAYQPFTLTFEHVDWFTLYQIRQHLAAKFWDEERVFLAGG